MSPTCVITGMKTMLFSRLFMSPFEAIVLKVPVAAPPAGDLEAVYWKVLSLNR